MLQIDLVGPLRGAVYKHTSTGIDVFSKKFFTVPLPNVRAQRIAQELTLKFFQNKLCTTYDFVRLRQ